MSQNVIYEIKDYSDKELEELRVKDGLNNAAADSNIEFYGTFQHEGDFEIRAEAIFSNQAKLEHYRLRERIAEAETRVLWLKKGLHRLGSKEWFDVYRHYRGKHGEWRLYQGIIESIESGKYKMKEAKIL